MNIKYQTSRNRVSLINNEIPSEEKFYAGIHF